MNGSIHEDGKLWYGGLNPELSLLLFLLGLCLGEVLEEVVIPHTQLIPHSTYQWHYPPLTSHMLSYPYQDTHTHACARTLW